MTSETSGQLADMADELAEGVRQPHRFMGHGGGTHVQRHHTWVCGACGVVFEYEFEAGQAKPWIWVPPGWVTMNLTFTPIGETRSQTRIVWADSADCALHLLLSALEPYAVGLSLGAESPALQPSA